MPQNIVDLEKSSGILPEDFSLITALRGLAILSIVFGHVGGYWAYPPYSSYLHICGSTFFFFLSGGVLYHSYRRSSSITSFYVKRFARLLLPYYMICLLSLLVYIFYNADLPVFSLNKLLDWVAIRPSKTITPFPLGQLWFLHTYVIILAVAPVYFLLLDEYKKAFLFSLLLFVGLAFIKMYLDIDQFTNICGYSIYNTSFYSIFFMTGAVAFSADAQKHRRLSAVLVLTGVIVFVGQLINTSSVPDLEKHFVERDLVAAFATTLFTGFLFLFKAQLYRVFNSCHSFATFLRFMHKHTFSIYLLHTLTIFFVERQLGLINPQDKGLFYGITKSVAVITIVAILSIPFTALSNLLSNYLISLFYRFTQGTYSGSRNI